MKVVVMGAGGVGGYFGARLAAAGHDVGFVARGRHLQALARNGLRVLSQHGDIVLPDASVSADPGAFGIADFILFTVKSYDCEGAAAAIAPAIGPQTGIIPLLNGIDHIAQLQKELGTGHVLGGVANISALIAEPGVIRHFDMLHILRVGEMDDRPSDRVRKFRAACVDAGIECPVPGSIERELWQKMAMICTLAGANCLTRLPLGPCRGTPATRALMQDLAEETVAVGRAEGVSLPEDQASRTMTVLDSLPAGMKASMLASLERGERLEVAALNGAVTRLGEKHGIATPAHRAVQAALAPHENGNS